jgi:hypothetical protein
MTAEQYIDIFDINWKLYCKGCEYYAHPNNCTLHGMSVNPERFFCADWNDCLDCMPIANEDENDDGGNQ